MTPGSQCHCVVICCIFLFTYSLGGNNIGIAGAQALADYLKHYTNLQKLE